MRATSVEVLFVAALMLITSRSDAGRTYNMNVKVKNGIQDSCVTLTVKAMGPGTSHELKYNEEAQYAISGEQDDLFRVTQTWKGGQVLGGGSMCGGSEQVLCTGTFRIPISGGRALVCEKVDGNTHMNSVYYTATLTTSNASTRSYAVTLASY